MTFSGSLVSDPFEAPYLDQNLIWPLEDERVEEIEYQVLMLAGNVVIIRS
jgi:hypothetical protein